MSHSPNADQIAYWNGEIGARWAAEQESIDRVMSPLTAMLLEHAAPEPGMRVLDVGCGAGATTLALAARVGVGGSVLGVDISHPMLEVAARRVAQECLGNVELKEADAAAYPFGPRTIDLVVSRFGVMFFADPVAAFTNIRTALKPGGRLAFACWRRMEETPFFHVAAFAARPHLPPQTPPDQTPPDQTPPGPLAFADPARVRHILGEAGFSDVTLTPRDPAMLVGAPDEVAEFAMRMGPVARAMTEATDAQREAASAAVRAAMRARAGADGITHVPGGIWLVAARV